MKSGLKKWISYIILAVTLIIVLVTGLRDQDLKKLTAVLYSIGLDSLLYCAAAWVCYILLGALAIRYFLKTRGYPISLQYALFVSLSGAFYSNVTPGATGGQPMQVYYLTKRNVPAGVGTSMVTVQFFCFQTMLAVFGTVFGIVWYGDIALQLNGNMWMLYFGYIYNLFVVILTFLMAANKKVVLKLIDWSVALLAKMRLAKDPAAWKEKGYVHVEHFHQCIQSLRRNPGTFFILLLLAGLRVLTLMAVVPLVYRALLLSGTGTGLLIALAVMLFLTAAWTPLPGASGAQEIGFNLFFSGHFKDEKLFMGLLLWRFFTYYISILFGAVAVTAATVRENRTVRKQ